MTTGKTLYFDCAMGAAGDMLLGALFALFALASMLMGRTMALQNLRPGLPQKTPPAWRVLHYGFCFALVSALLLFQAYYIGP